MTPHIGDAAIFVLDATETQRWQGSDTGCEELKAAVNDQLAYPSTDHYQVCVLSATHELLWFD